MNTPRLSGTELLGHACKCGRQEKKEEAAQQAAGEGEGDEEGEDEEEQQVSPCEVMRWPMTCTIYPSRASRS